MLEKVLSIIMQITVKLAITIYIYKNYNYEIAVLYLLLENWAVNYATNFWLKEKYK